MDNFYIRRIQEDFAEYVIKDVGFWGSYTNTALSKYKFVLIKIHNLICPQANIIKQLALSVGADAAVHKDVITCRVDKSDILLGCTHSQLKNLAEKLAYQPFELNKLAPLLLEQITHNPAPIKIRDTLFDWSKKTYIMGILNITPDSFSDGGQFINPDSALDHAYKMIESIVDIIDIGGESTRPFLKETEPQTELKRVIPVIQKIRNINSSIPISIDTRHSLVAKEAVLNGADIINDVSGLSHDSEMIGTVSDLNIPVIIMHSLSDPETMQINPVYSENIIDAISKDLYNKTSKAINAGVKRENILIDPGIGFGKTLEHNLEIIKRVKEFTSLGFPLLVGISRKSVIADILKLSVSEREEANIALNSYLAANGVNIIRIHDVEKHYRAFKVLDRILK